MATREEALPYYKWFWQHWRANRDVQRKLNYVDRGLYRELLDEAWAEGSLPSEIDALADICGCPVEVMADSWKRISAHWELRDGRLYNDKLDAQRTEKDALRVSRIQTGRIGGLVKTLHKLEADGADPQEIERVKQAEVEARDALAGAKQQLVDSDFLLDGGKQVLASASEPLANANPLLAVASGCHIEEKRREEEEKRKNSSEASSEPVFLDLPTVGPISKFEVREDLIAACEGLYPAVNVRQEIRNIRGWLDGNPTRRKTHRGTPKFIHAWMSRTQDLGGSRRGNGNQGRNGFSGEEMSRLLDSFGGSETNDAHRSSP